MNVRLRFTDWPLRAKMAALLVAVSLLPLALSAYIDLRRDQTRMLDDMKSLLEARGDQIVHELDSFHRGYQRSVDGLARFPDTAAYCAQTPEQRAAHRAAILGILSAYPASDAGVRGAALIDGAGRIVVATETPLTGVNLSDRPAVQAALQGRAVVTDPFISSPGSGAVPTIAYLAPMLGADQRVSCVAVLWVRATALWDAVKTANALAGPGSYAELFDREGIRIAHTNSDDTVFHPGGPLDPKTVNRIVAERRFGARTRALLDDVRAFPEQFARARAQTPDPAVFRGFAPVIQAWHYGVARRFRTVPWTVFYMVPEAVITGQIAQATRERAMFAAGIIAAAGLVGLAFAASILGPIRALSRAAASIAAGDLTARVQTARRDELGQFGASFNAMAEQVQAQATGLQRSRDELDLRVKERTAQLEAEVGERQLAQTRLQAQLQRMILLDQITRAIGERQDLQSIHQVVIRSLEDQLPADFACVCRYDAVANALVVIGIGVRSRALAMELAMTEQARIEIDQNGLSRCIRGRLVYEPDLGASAFPFPQRLLRGGLQALVVAPLQAEGQVFGILVTARREPHSFSSGECEFLRQLSEHVALAAQQARLHGALQQAYDDLRQTQQTVMQQERLRALGQMASGIAHDINNAISPVVLYTESLLEREPGLSARTRDYLEQIARAVADVASTVARMREFYRQRETQLQLAPVQLNALVRQVVDLTRARWSDMPQQRGIVIGAHADLAPDLPLILGVESEIREALINLIFNAVDAMAEGGTLTLRTRAAQWPGAPAGVGAQQACVEVSDTGSGMDEATRRRCLEPFFTTKGERGTGLGLAMVYGIVQRHGADIAIDSAVGRGTTVTLRFAVPQGAAAPGSVPLQLAYAAPPPRLRILVVDDDPLLLKSLQDTLQSEGHAVVAANAGQAGIDAFQAAQARGERFGAVITDLGMPYVDGRKVAAAVKLASPSTPVVMLTGWGQRLVAEGDTPDDVDQVLSKPPKLRELRQTLSELCQPREKTDDRTDRPITDPAVHRR